MPGHPGIKGHQGLVGQDGSKGESGSSGEKGRQTLFKSNFFKPFFKREKSNL